MQLAEKGIYKIDRLGDKQPLISEAEVITGECFSASFYLANMYEAEKKLLKQYGNNLEGFYFPWSFLVTNNCSIEKNMFLQVDGFDNSFTRWGCEDLDFGYRLYKNGFKFIKQNDIRSVHQEHPVNFNDRGEENIYYFTKKYESIDLLLFYYGYLISVDKAIANKIMQEIEGIKNEQYTDLLDLYRRLLIILRNKNIKKDSLDKNWFYEIKSVRNDIASYKEALEVFFNSTENRERFPNFIYSFYSLIKKSLNIHFEHLN